MRSLLYEKKILFSGTSPFYTQLKCLLRNTQHVSRLQMWTIPFSFFKRVQESAADISVSQYQLRVSFQLHNRVHKQRNNLHLPLYDLA